VPRCALFPATTSAGAAIVAGDHGRANPTSNVSKGNHPMSSMALNELGKMLTAAEVAEMLHLHVNTVKRLGDRGELKYYRVCKRGDRRFLLEDVRRFLDQNR
jgi:excisionase family DNA binding protein